MPAAYLTHFGNVKSPLNLRQRDDKEWLMNHQQGLGTLSDASIKSTGRSLPLALIRLILIRAKSLVTTTVNCGPCSHAAKVGQNG